MPCMPNTQPPGTSTLPVNAGSMESARTVWMHFGVCSIAQPHSSMRRLGPREQARGRPDFLGGHPGDRRRPFRREACARARAARRSRGSTARRMAHRRACSPMMTLSNASASASSVPGRTCSHSSARRASSVSRGSTTMIFGFVSSASRTLKRVSPSGPELSGLWPQNSMQAGGVSAGEIGDGKITEGQDAGVDARMEALGKARLAPVRRAERMTEARHPTDVMAAGAGAECDGFGPELLADRK